MTKMNRVCCLALTVLALATGCAVGGDDPDVELDARTIVRDASVRDASRSPDVSDGQVALRDTRADDSIDRSDAGGVDASDGARDGARDAATADSPCASGTTLCGLRCANLASDVSNCGACGTVCTAGASCMAGVCSTPSCVPPSAICSGGTCVDLSADPANCGACGNGCPLGAGCIGGLCRRPTDCADGQTNCSGVCVDLATDPSNCGSCGTRCEDGACTAGRCGSPATGCRSNAECGRAQYCQTPADDCSAVGVCADVPSICPGGGLVDPPTVCGCDGRSYESACAAAMARVSIGGRCAASL